MSLTKTGIHYECHIWKEVTATHGPTFVPDGAGKLYHLEKIKLSQLDENKDGFRPNTNPADATHQLAQV